MADPTISQIAQGATALLTVASFTKLYFMDQKLGAMMLLMEHEDVGLLHRMKRQERRADEADRRAGRHSDAIRSLGAELEE